jgi:hypothetical protein
MYFARFDNKRIVSGAYDGKIKVWDLPAALDVRTPQQDLCLRTLVVRICSHIDLLTAVTFLDFKRLRVNIKDIL